MSKKSKVTAVPQYSPNRRLVVPRNYPSVVGEQPERVYRPARSISMLIKQGLAKGITKDISNTNGNNYDPSEGSCPKGLRLDVDTFDLATTMLRHGENAKTLTKELNK